MCPGEKPKEDLRQRRTKKLLVSALLELMEERPFQELSVVDICDRAMVHRTTFYAHFEDKHALLRYAVLTLQREFETTVAEGEEQSPRSYFIAMFRTALGFVREHRRLYLSGLAGGGTELQLLEDVVAGEFFRRCGGAPGDLEGELRAHFYAGAILTVIRWWLERDLPMDEARMLRAVERLIPAEAGTKGR